MQREFRRSDFVVRVSDKPGKKYVATLRIPRASRASSRASSRPKRVHFGAIRPDGTPYEQFRDSTPLRHFARWDHGDDARRQRYAVRHRRDIVPGFTAGWLSWLFLWS
jgi:hypothetical protein